MRIRRCVSDGWRLFWLDAWPLIAALLVALIGDLTLGLLELPLATQ